ncbi:Rieske 2Fe-2S domain-containing protein [Aquirufa echingensis]|mgnify:FL=1|jgi:cytochrome b6-f complex iron-sulfur subunit|uniref:Rieske 2Fe-2S domain-containing protein n=1 Tax=Aquirufa echingensis TaxID=3096516 RepID=A0ABW6D056_9BACT
MQSKMKRNEFLKSLGLKGASLLAVYCGASALSSCENESLTPASAVDFTLDLSNASYSALNTVGKYVIYNQIVVARVSSTSFAAVTQICTHEGKAQVIYNGSKFYCTAHGATFSTSGTAESVTSKALKTYQTALTGTTLRVYA